MRQNILNTNPLLYFLEPNVYSWAMYDVKCCLLYCAISSFYNSSFLIKFSTFHTQQPFFISVIGVYAFHSPFLPASTRYNATNTLLSYTFVLLFRVLYLHKVTVLRLGYMFILPRTSYCRILYLFRFYSG
jgi:hypothetical protein